MKRYEITFVKTNTIVYYKTIEAQSIQKAVEAFKIYTKDDCEITQIKLVGIRTKCTIYKYSLTND